MIEDATFVVTDIETTGLSPDRNRVTEVGCVYVRNGEIVDEKHSLINPEQFIPQMIQQMTGITNAMVMGAPKGDEIFPTVRTWFADDAVFVAHNASFDYGFLQSSFRRHSSSPLTNPQLCTVRLSRRLLPKRKSWNLDSITAYFGIRTKNRHSALGDAHATAKVLLNLLEILANDYECETVDEVLSFQRREIGGFKPVPEHFKKILPTVSTLPETPGVYFMRNGKGEVLYIGKAASLRDRVSGYFRAGTIHSQKNSEMIKRVRQVTYETTDTELSALLTEARLIKEHQPPYNTLLRRYRKYAFLRLDTTDPFPRVDMALEIEADGAEYYGPFANRDQVQMLIEMIGHLFTLRTCTDPLQPDPGFSPCMYYQLKRCNAPCAMLESVAEYAREVDRLREWMSGSGEGVLTALNDRMLRYSEELQFEEAARLRDRIKDYRRVFSEIFPVASALHNKNVVAVLPSGAAGKREILMVRHGRLAKQLVVGRTVPIKKIQALIQRLYSTGLDIPVRFGRAEIEEMRIVAGYLHQRRSEATFVHIVGSLTEDIDRKIIEGLKE